MDETKLVTIKHNKQNVPGQQVSFGGGHGVFVVADDECLRVPDVVAQYAAKLGWHTIDLTAPKPEPLKPVAAKPEPEFPPETRPDEAAPKPVAKSAAKNKVKRAEDEEIKAHEHDVSR